MKKVLIGLAVLLLVGLIIAGVGYNKLRAIDVEQVTDRVWVLKGVGGNVTVLKTGAGAVMVDSMTFTFQGERLAEVAEEITGEPVVMMMNTHFHIDHSHGNPALDKSVDVVATSNTLKHMQHHDPIPGYWEGDAAESLPNKLVESVEEITVGDQRIRFIHPGLGHTDGDLVALFVDQRVVVMGDLLFNQHYPNIDLEHGGSIAEWPGTLDNVLKQPFDQVVPGHGEVTNADGIRQFQRFMQQLIMAGATAKAEGWSREETIAKADLTEDAGYGIIAVPFLFTLDRQFVLGRAWDEAVGGVQLAP